MTAIHFHFFFLSFAVIVGIVHFAVAQNGYNYPSPSNSLQPNDLSNNLGGSGGGSAFNTGATASSSGYSGANQGISPGIYSGQPNVGPSTPSFGAASSPLPSSSGFGNQSPSFVKPSSSFGNQSPYASQSGAQIPFGGQTTGFGGSPAASGVSGNIGGGGGVGVGFNRPSASAFDRNNDNRGVVPSFDRNDINAGGSAPSQGGLGGNDDGSYAGGDFSAIPGTAGVDYTIYSEIPKTSFDCKQQQFPGYYADVEAQCQVFHICALNTTFDFLCPNGTIFSQEHLVCVWWNQFDCNSAPSLYGNNAYIYDYSKTGNSGSSLQTQNDLGSGSVQPGFDNTQGLNYPTASGQRTPSRPLTGPSGPSNSFVAPSRGPGNVAGGGPSSSIPSINSNFPVAPQVTPRPFNDFNAVPGNLGGLSGAPGGYQTSFVAPVQSNLGQNPYGINQSPTESSLQYPINQSPSGPNAFATSPLPQPSGGNLPSSLDKSNRDPSSAGILPSPPSSQYLPVRKS